MTSTMTPTKLEPDPAAGGLLQRLQTVLGVLAPDDVTPVATASLFDVVAHLIEVVRRCQNDAACWLLAVGLTGAMPDASLVHSMTRSFALLPSQPEQSVTWLLDAVSPLAARNGNATATLRVVTERPIIDVNFTARSNFLTGIQRVVRGVVSQWEDRQDVEIVAWSERGGAFRALQDDERQRLLEREVAEWDDEDTWTDDHPEILVPWGVPVVLLEVPTGVLSDRLAAMAQLTDAPVRLVGYDCIPVASAETVPLDETEKFGRYLELVKHADRVAGISQAAAAEFRGFTRALAAQGLAGPQVIACPLPHTTPVGDVRGDTVEPTRPVVVCIGTVGRRKNQLALVEAAELLWREGLDFELRILGHLAAERSPLSGLLSELEDLGRPLVVETGVSDRRIADTLDEARCLVFPTRHEGFGLPIVEALSHHVPVITSDFGSTREVAEGQGGLLIDPDDVEALAAALRGLLTDDALHARLVAEARARPVRGWSEYADELWTALLT